MKKIIPIFLTLLLLSSGCQRNITVKHENKPLTKQNFEYNGKPIHPYCLRFDDTEESLLAKCNTNGYKASSISLDNGLVSAFYDNTITEYSSPEDIFGYDAYQIIQNKGNSFLVYIVSNLGGSSTYTGIHWVKINGDKLSSTESIIGGDRCDGGVDNYAIKDDQLFYSINATPSDLFSGLKEFTPDRYNDFDDSAAGCVATQNFHYDAQTKQSLFDSITFLKDNITGSNPGEENYQKCFLQLSKKYISENKITLSTQELKQFQKDFIKSCIK